MALFLALFLCIAFGLLCGARWGGAMLLKASQEGLLQAVQGKLGGLDSENKRKLCLELLRAEYGAAAEESPTPPPSSRPQWRWTLGSDGR